MNELVNKYRSSLTPIGPIIDKQFEQRPWECNIVVLGGTNELASEGANSEVGTNVYLMDPSLNSWTQRGRSNQPLHHASTTFIPSRNLIVVTGGADDRRWVYSKAWFYHVVPGEWERVPDMSYQRIGHALVADDETGTVYAVGGRDNFGNILRCVECLEEGRVFWREKRPLEEGLVGCTATSTRGAAYDCGAFWVCGGFTFNEVSKMLQLSDDIHTYSALSDSWSKVCQIGTGPRAYAAAVFMDQSLFLFGGVVNRIPLIASDGDPGCCDAKAPRYEVTSSVVRYCDGCWRECKDLPKALSKVGVTSIGNWVLIFGGISSVYKTESNVYCYNALADHWITTLIPNMPVPLCQPAAGLWASEDILGKNGGF